MLKCKFGLVVLAVLVGLVFSGCVTPDKNRAPSVAVVSCPETARVGTEVSVSVVATDRDGDRIAYQVAFGDGVQSEWSELLVSGVAKTFVHTYDKEGDFGVYAIASDEHYLNSGWGDKDYIEVTAPAEEYKIAIMKHWVSSPEEDYERVARMGCTHLFAFNQWSIDYDMAWKYGVKTIFSIGRQGTDDEIRDYVRELKDKLYTGGDLAWPWHELDLIGDWEGNDKRESIKNYNLIREIDPDKANHPVMVLFDMTDRHPDFPGWERNHTNLNHDILVIDDYPNFPGADPQAELEKGWNLVKTYENLENKQVIPAIQCFYGGDDSVRPFDFPDIWHQHKFWEEKLGTKSRGFYCWGIGDVYEGVGEDEELEKGVRRVTEDIGG